MLLHVHVSHVQCWTSAHSQVNVTGLHEAFLWTTVCRIRYICTCTCTLATYMCSGVLPQGTSLLGSRNGLSSTLSLLCVDVYILYLGVCFFHAVCLHVVCMLRSFACCGRLHVVSMLQLFACCGRLHVVCMLRLFACCGFSFVYMLLTGDGLLTWCEEVQDNTTCAHSLDTR